MRITASSAPLWLLSFVIAGASGCAADRPARNGVFNENQYVRKDFLIRSGDTNGTTLVDDGWLMKATITSVSTPNPLGWDAFLVFPGSESESIYGGQFVRFRVTQDKLEMLSMREISGSSLLDGSGKPTPVADPTKDPEMVNAWTATNVDLKYRVNLDGELTNFYEENQENNWQDRQWLKLSFAKNDASDVAPFGANVSSAIAHCTDSANATTTLEPDTFQATQDPKDSTKDYMEWVVQVNFPLRYDLPECNEAFGERGATAQKLNRNNVTAEIKYSMVRALPMPANPANPVLGKEVTYAPLEIDEKDPIRHKYGPLSTVSVARDPESQLLAARQLVNRFDPTRKITWWFDASFPDYYKHMFSHRFAADPSHPQDPKEVSIEDATNAILAGTGAAARVEFKDPKTDLAKGDPVPKMGDVRFNMIWWIADKDVQDFFAGVEQSFTDPRTGETLNASIGFNDTTVKDYYAQRIDAYLKTLGACAQFTPGSADGLTPPTCNRDINSVDPWPADPLGTGPACTVGDTVPMVPDYAKKYHDGTSSLFGKIQSYLHKDASSTNPSTGQPYGPLGLDSFIVPTDPEFEKTYFKVLPYFVFGNPDGNEFVTPEGQTGVYGPGGLIEALKTEAAFHETMGAIDRGMTPFDGLEGPQGLQNATAFSKQLKGFVENHSQLRTARNRAHRSHALHLDDASAFSLEAVMLRDARHCVDFGTGPHWESKDEYVRDMLDTYWSQVLWHEFGHAMGLDHNFMASVDKPNFPAPISQSLTTVKVDANGNPVLANGKYQYEKKQVARYPLNSSSVMEYNANPDRVFWQAGWGPYDIGAINFIYSNSSASHAAALAKPAGAAPSASITGQAAANYPWNDALGWNADGSEKGFLFCNENNRPYTPLCRDGDLGTTPSEIIANELATYDWQYQWRNYRAYHKFWDQSHYADAPTALIYDLRRFMPMWTEDWDSADIIALIRRTGAATPPAKGSSQDFYNELALKFNRHMSAANQMAAAFHKAVIQQTSGDRPFKTLYDPYFGDVAQQGITIDKLMALNAFTTLWPVQDYSLNRIEGTYFGSFSIAGDSEFQTVAEDAVESMVGGQYNDVFPYFKPLAVAQFSEATHDINFGGRTEVRDWIGGYVFDSERAFLDYWRGLAVKNHFPACDTPTTNDLTTCLYDPRAKLPDVNHTDVFNEFIGPDHRRWAFAFIQDRNQWVVVDRDRNTATYLIIRQYNADVVQAQNDGSAASTFGGPYAELLPLKYFLDAFRFYN